jgi:hypothetical protein
MEESPTFQDLLKRHELSDRSCNKLVSDVHLEEISRSNCKQWKSLPSHLGLETIVADDIDRSQKDPREKRYDFFLQWKDIKGTGATYKQLINALLKIKCKKDADKVCQLLKNCVCPQAQPLTVEMNGAYVSNGACALPPAGELLTYLNETTLNSMQSAAQKWVVTHC